MSDVPQSGPLVLAGTRLRNMGAEIERQQCCNKPAAIDKVNEALTLVAGALEDHVVRFDTAAAKERLDKAWMVLSEAADMYAKVT